MGFGVRSLPGLTEPEQFSCMVTLVLAAIVLYFAGYGCFYLVLTYYSQKHEEKRHQEWLASPKKWHD